MMRTQQIGHAAQIYAEMLGQVCHPEFYDVMDNDYQEVSSQTLRSLTIVLCNSYSTCDNLLILCEIPESISCADF